MNFGPGDRASSKVRRLACLLLLSGAASCQAFASGPGSAPEPASWPTNGWDTAPLETAGFHSGKMADGLLALHQAGVPIHSLMLIRHGAVVLDAYFYPYDGSTVHDLASVTKSVMTTLIGIAADQGKLSLDDPMVSFFPDRTIANLDERKQSITVAHLASMSSGLECTEEARGTYQQMMASEDWVQFALDRPMQWAPGAHFEYCDPSMHLLSPILQRATGMTALEFARTYLFEPLGIDEATWTTDPQGFNRGWGDLALYPEDAAKLGLLWLQNGRWDGLQVVSEEWVRAASERRMKDAGGRPEDYGYGWWVSDPAEEEIAFVQAAGAGGQLIKVLPELDMMVVSTGSGSETDQIDPYVIAAIGDLGQALPADPAGEAALQAAIEAIVQPPTAAAVAPFPESASVISGKRYVLEENDLGLEWFRLDFDQPDEALLQFQVAGEAEARQIRVGLDGVYRTAPEGARPGLGRGGWEDENTFALEYDTLPGYQHFTFRMTFNGDRVDFDLAERVWGTRASLGGSVQGP